jgi:hypothetical protein
MNKKERPHVLFVTIILARIIVINKKKMSQFSFNSEYEGAKN